MDKGRSLKMNFMIFFKGEHINFAVFYKNMNFLFCNYNVLKH